MDMRTYSAAWTRPPELVSGLTTFTQRHGGEDRGPGPLKAYPRAWNMGMPNRESVLGQSLLYAGYRVNRQRDVLYTACRDESSPGLQFYENKFCIGQDVL